ncbi:hypothetical protein U1Q18_010749 [Sarracenia purpurea var. burkii]
MEMRKYKIGGKKMSIVVGPWGGNGGSHWDDGIYSGGVPVTAEKHGGGGGSRTAHIKLQYPEEFLTSVSGHYCPVVSGGNSVIRSLTFKTNQKTFGPYGVEEGTPFSFSTDGAQIAGFKGRSGWFVDALGFHLSHIGKKKLYQKVKEKLEKFMSPSPPDMQPPRKIYNK